MSHLLYRYHADWALKTARRLNIPLIMVPHGGLDPYCFSYRPLPKKLWLRWHQADIKKRATLLYATERERQKARERLRAEREEVIGWPLDRERLDAGAEAEAVSRQSRQFAIVGRIHPMKRTAEVVRAFVKTGCGGYRLLVAGPCSEEISRDDLTRLMCEGPHRNVEYLGQLGRRQLGEVYATVRGVIQFSHRENFGYSVAEAMAAGRPVFVSEEVDLADVVERFGAGLVFRVRTEQDVRDGIARIASLREDDLDEMGRNAKRAARETFSPAVFTTRLAELVRTVLVGSGKERYGIS
jgi:glycosyltransferase involved in cell wall biosynthesis